MAMTIEPHHALQENAGDVLEADVRWLLIQRIVESRSFERATQLRKILLYVSRSAILEPERVLREYDIAYNVLDRRKDFDPANDNIVRSQFTHLRRKLEGYFLDEGSAEMLIVKIPKGSYVPVFSPVRVAVAAVPPLTTGVANLTSADMASLPSTEVLVELRRRSRRESILALTCVALVVALVWFGVRLYGSSAAKVASAASSNAFVQFLGRTEGKVSIVVPDTMLVEIEEARGGKDIGLSDYIRADYPQRQIAEVGNTDVRNYLMVMSGGRETSFNEAMVAASFQSTFQRLNVPAQARYARDLHVSDLNLDNVILIGSAASDPWDSIFEGALNFRFHEDRTTNSYYFENLHPLAGEQSKYPVKYATSDGDAVGYADVALTQNESHTGYVLMFLASDAQEAESSANFLLNGKLPPEIAALLNRKDLHYFEIFLRGRHLAGQADDSFELVTMRPR
jgi:hypothetical protein